MRYSIRPKFPYYLFLIEGFSHLGTYLFQNSKFNFMTINKELLAKRQEVKENKPDFVRPERLALC